MNRIPDPTAFDRPAPADPTAPLSDMLAAQAQSLDALFADLVGHAAANITDFPVAAEAYARLAFRAQWNCRASIEAMSRLRYREALAARHGDAEGGAGL
ncbi:hypothetical protein [Sphingomonas sp. Root710]|uniref:hypothetical protein n=1 Tax=Sphingomonas sp. Root710 TaxID=1736594 RepID=UPI000A658544|nr:hypothetical protein [Sphingomonas sp. Root710]